MFGRRRGSRLRSTESLLPEVVAVNGGGTDDFFAPRPDFVSKRRCSLAARVAAKTASKEFPPFVAGPFCDARRPPPKFPERQNE